MQQINTFLFNFYLNSIFNQYFQNLKILIIISYIHVIRNNIT